MADLRFGRCVAAHWNHHIWSRAWKIQPLFSYSRRMDSVNSKTYWNSFLCSVLIRISYHENDFCSSFPISIRFSLSSPWSLQSPGLWHHSSVTNEQLVSFKREISHCQFELRMKWISRFHLVKDQPRCPDFPFSLNHGFTASFAYLVKYLCNRFFFVCIVYYAQLYIDD